MLAFKIYHHLHPPDCDSPCTLHHQSFDGGGGDREVMCTYGGGGKAGKLHVLVEGGRGVTSVPAILHL